MTEPVLQRSCALCGTVDGGPRHQVVLPSGQSAWYHLPGSQDCTTSGADPHPEFDEDPAISQQRHALTNDPGSPTPDISDPLTTDVVDASDPANHNQPVQGA